MGAVFFAVVIVFIVNWKEVTTNVPLMTLSAQGQVSACFCCPSSSRDFAQSNTVQATALQLAQEKRNVDDEQDTVKNSFSN